ncbi:winged helix-turn-helix domain-containing protein [Enterobacter sp. CC120223-11]|uniref:winged helix-turn-helix domain-containing protein n=1 Tax=Enterobacter sp. CC120223-11 TaxID=1378073 RepID=UPI000BC6B349|nr:winged helix-turn-helix domain-containing protein [Enterobacter sp. CC120223-11]SNY75310.1 DNA-binding winged-HTH domains [Enterobacter sp. CC120223-11]
MHNNKHHGHIISIIKKGNGYVLKRKNTELTLSKNQSLLISCLINNINDKAEIINAIWGDAASKSRQNSYNQLIYQLRQRLTQAGIEPEILITHPRYGLVLNKAMLLQDRRIDHYMVKTLNDNLLNLSSGIVKSESRNGIELTPPDRFIF